MRVAPQSRAARTPYPPARPPVPQIRYFVFIRPVTPGARALATRIAQKHLARGLRGVADPAARAALLAKLSPAYPIGCKRVITSDDFYPALAQPHVSLETGAILRVVPSGVVVADGAGGEATIPLDVLVYATGFDVVASIDSLGVVGAGGLSMRRAFELKGGPEAYLGVAAPAFPNMFMMMGPNTGLGHSSMITMIEAQARYAAEVIARARARVWARVEVKAAVCDAYNKDLQAELRKNVWGSCVSWYNRAGRRAPAGCPRTRKGAAPNSPLPYSHTNTAVAGAKNVVLWPFTVIAYHWRMRSVDWSAYDVRA